MKVDFNNLRVRLVVDYNKLVKKLDCVVERDCDKIEIKRLMDALRLDVVAIGCLYEENDNDCVSVLGDDLSVDEFKLE